MDTILKAKWVEALRGGKFEQGRNHLRKGNNQCCCLGVLCDIVDPKGWSKHPFTKTDAKYYKHRGNEGLPGEEFLNKVGLDLDQAQELARQNDQGISFRGIATYIEERML